MGYRCRVADQIQVLVSGVTATEALIEEAIALQADAILVHHGYFWRGEEGHHHRHEIPAG